MPSNVQRVPRGLLALLGVVGQNPPATMSDEYRGALEMLELIAAEIPSQSASATNAAAATGATIDIAVPAGEMWFLLNAEAGIAAAPVGRSNLVSIQLGFAGALNTVGIDRFVPGATMPVPFAAYTAAAFFTPAKPVLLKPGDTVRGRLIATDAAAAQSLFVFATYRPIPV
jgi:hypothetical protein